MNRFISLPWKLLIVMLLVLLVMTVGLTSFSLVRINDDFSEQQQHKRTLGQQQFSQYNQLLENQLRVWVESFAELSFSNQDAETSIRALQQAFSRQIETLHLHLNVDHVWLYTEPTEITYQSTALIPAAVERQVQLAFQQQAPQSDILCDHYCVKSLAVPLLAPEGQMAVVAMTTTLVDILFYLSRSLQVDVAIVSHNSSQDPARPEDIRLLSSSNAALLNALYYELPDLLNVSEIYTEGLRLQQDQQYYFAHMQVLDVSHQRQYHLIIIEDITDYVLANQRYQRQIIYVAVLAFLMLALLTYMITKRLSGRLMMLAARLPMLANREFTKFRQQSDRKTTLFSDEVDNLNEATLTLSWQLETLNEQVQQHTQELENIAMYDLLTGLPNRNMLQYQLKKALAGLDDTPGHVGLLFLDLDQFKKVNDSRGHAFGDQLLIEAAIRLRACIHTADTVCRFGGDEFVIILTKMAQPEETAKVAAAILHAFKQPIELAGDSFQIGTSIGISVTSDSTTQTEDMIRQADLAMYQAKAKGGNDWHHYTAEMYQEFAYRLQLETEVRTALQQEEFSLSLQPQIEVATGKLYGFEALLRWCHPQRGMVPPDDFIGVIENSHLMVPLGYWVIERCFKIARQLMQHGHHDLKIAINLSADQFVDPNLTQFLKQQLLAHQVSADYFELELTESTLVKNVSDTLVSMHAIKKMGFGFAIDDFGTGYSSLSYLKQMPVDTIKIDKSFLFGMLDNHADFQIIASTIAMVHKLELKVVAEGVESSAQLRMLRQHRCDLAQGFYFSKAVPEPDLLQFIHDKFKDGHWIGGVKN
ncbi:bifunctional diguanylate cyclase/phosphodiesterase [Alkalimonas collagenimarina]|uniref:Bifunctional diguanylate cyclase/phosphodiesterase n=1 Tax=Alkalimonas collagenimarina TaxID=400390 RepID=A0ABT9GXR9_9GAMM|nr:bifunctional diguanylate cyclase/phosphodiesterase [Alkalimonas collagenimarina]MDP4535842.1 bifunctional diguanylate cyclase/phosphodiesterase [Alkalimonas collagenimarina]